MAKGRKTGGRQPGTPNKRTRELQELIAQTMGDDWCPVVEMAKLSRDASLPVDLRLKALGDVAPYLRGKVAPIRDATDTAGGLELLIAMASSATPRAAAAMPTRFDPATGVALVDDAPAAPVPPKPPMPTPEPATSAPKPKPTRLHLPPRAAMDHDPFAH